VRKIVACFPGITYRRFLNPDGTLADECPRELVSDTEVLIDFYRQMWFARLFGKKAVALQRTGKLGTFAEAEGEEAIGVGIAAAMRRERDVLFPPYRAYAAQFPRGVRARDSLTFWGGSETGNDVDPPFEDWPVSITIGSHVLPAVGAARAFQVLKEDRVAVAIFGDGATSRGDVAEALNLAGVWSVPCVFVIVNNGWAISLPRDQQTAAETLAQKGIAAGIVQCEQVDGNDVLIVYRALSEAIESAARGQGPSVIEALTYRLADHTTADDAGHYRDAVEVERRRKEEPLVRTRRLLESVAGWDDEKEEKLLAGCTAELESEVKAYLGRSKEQPTAMLGHLFAELPDDLVEQRAVLAALKEGAS